LAPGRSTSRASFSNRCPGGGTRLGSITPNTPSREHESGAGKARDVGRRRNHKRQPECSATMKRRAPRHFARKTGRRDHLGKRVWPETSEIDEISIGLGVAGHGAAERRLP
jgi:hypothetical protein